MPYTGARSFLIIVFSLIGPAFVGAAQQQKPDEAALIAEAREMWQKGQQWPAINKLKEAITLKPGDAAALTELADMYLVVKSNELARESIAEALKVNPNYAPAHHKKAIL